MTICARIRAQGGEVTLDRWGFRLKRGRLTDTHLAWVRERKREIMREIWPAFDDWEERAAIREFDGGQPRAEAEEAAYKEIAGC